MRAVLFDAVGTLIHPQPAVAEVYRAAAARHGVHLDTATVHRRFRQALARQEAADATDPQGRTSPPREQYRWQAIVAEVFPQAHNPAGLFADLWQHFAEPAHWRLDEEVAVVWQTLAGQGLTLGIASNFDARLYPICQALLPLSRCQHQFVSSELGYRKPAGGFFRAIEEQLGLPPHQILLVGDDPRNDYRAARAAGWQALLLDRDGRHFSPPVADHQSGFRRDFTIARLSSLTDLLVFKGPHYCTPLRPP